MHTERAPVTLTLTLTAEQADAVWETLLDGAMAALRGAPEQAITADEYRELARQG